MILTWHYVWQMPMCDVVHVVAVVVHGGGMTVAVAMSLCVVRLEAECLGVR